ncbi:Helicase Sen1, N-terminal [Kalmanozyma brasiliensis GHG001]|uniref:SEN1 N terminal-domain-containing protein n=1 Tax=Kalmanozyma brasiliensis (strain GHG001) TaxID=1365824 RepID=V5ER39_KALBG|nr:Helicase Sen1, N-terminal [Kalmanozyma brasiliensis GHG001]EST05413.1 Helicase Sen1, N-terminal [Kalmanozyma brasiliensis GHG001]
MTPPSTPLSGQAARPQPPALPANLQRLLDRTRISQADVNVFSDLLQAACDFLDAGKAKQSHIFCSAARPCDFELESCMLRVFSFRNKDNIDRWKARVTSAVYSNCLDCYKGFLRAKDHLRSTYLSSFPADKLDAFFAYLDSVEEQLALDAVQKVKGTAEHASLAKLSRVEIYAILTLVASPNAARLEATLKAVWKSEQLSNLSELPAGLLTLCIDQDALIRSFAARPMLFLKPLTPETASLSIFAQALRRVQKRYSDQGAEADWSLLSILLNAAPCLAADLTAAILSHVHDRHDRFGDVLRAYATLLKLRGPAIWNSSISTTASSSDKDDEYPTVILSGILDNPYFTKPLFESPQSVSNPRERGLFFGWMRPHLDTLQSHGGKLFSEAIKRLANFLFERMQQGHVPNECRAVAFTEAIDLVLNHSDEANSRQVVDLYAAPISQIALAKDSKSDEATRRAARDLIAQAFERDAKTLMRALTKLSSLSHNNNSKSKERSRAQRDNKQLVSPDVFYQEIARQDYPTVEICAMLWKEVYSVTSVATSTEGISILLGALARIAVCTQPSLQTHVLKPPSKGTTPAYDAYLTRVRQSVASVQSAFRAMRRSDFAEQLADYGELAREDEVQQLCTADAYSLLLLNLCPDPDIYRPAQNLLRQAFSTVESRADCFRILFQINHTSSFRALADYLQQFVNVTGRLIEANELAKWMVRSFADIVNVLAGSTDGLLRPGTSWTLIEDRSTLQAVALKAPTIWRLMCESVSSIFKRTPAWSTLLPREEMVAWFRDVTIFATEMVDALAVFRHVVRRAAEAPARWRGKSSGDADAEDLQPAEEEMMVHALALPIESATSWLRMNDEEILRETQSFILKALDQFGVEYDLPAKSKTKMLNFINEQMGIKDAAVRHTLLSLDELADLKVRLDPNAGVIEISDEDDDAASAASDVKTTQSTASTSTPGLPAASTKRADGFSSGSTKTSSASAATSTRPKEESDNSHWWAGVGNFGMISNSQEQRRRNKLKQSKLSFGKVDPSQIIDVDKDDSSPTTAKKPITLDFTRPKAQPASVPSAPINAYRGASARGAYPSAGSSSAASRLPKASTGKLAQLRQELGGANRSWKPQNANVRNGDARWGRNHEDDVTVKAPAAVSSVTGALINKMPGPTTEAGKAAAARKAGATDSDSTGSSSSSSDSSDEESEAKGLAALRGKVDRPRVPKINQPQRRQIVVKEDYHLERARRERADAERKRILRSPPDFSALHRSILVWNYAHEGNRPPAMAGKAPEYRRIQPHFSNANDYGSVLGPLLLLECWAQFQQAKEEAESSNASSIPLEVAGRSTVDAFVDVNVTIPPDSLPSKEFFNDTDIVRLKERTPAISGKQPKIVLAKVEAFKRHPQGHQMTLRCCLSEDRQGASTALVNRSKWELKKLFSLTTLHREFAALMAAPHYDLFSDVIRARVAPKVTLAADEVKKTMQGYQVNEPQARAILGSLATEGFSLIQGPPGTGKTKTICALIGAFVSNRKGPSTSVQAGKTQGKVGATKKILLCAPSNAAIDEVAKRARAGMRLADGKMFHPKVVRVGREDTMNVSVKDISLDYLIEQRLEGGSVFDNNRNGGSSADPSALHAEILNLKTQREQKQMELSEARAAGIQATVSHLEAEIRNLSAKRLGVMAKLDEAKDKQQSQHRQREADRRRARMEILGDADVICTTLSGAGHEMLSGVAFDFETVVIDEAAQAVELSSIIPLRYGCKQCIMVGDPNQLPPTVISQEADKLGYSQSLFVRMFERSPQAVHLLSIQYRMHPEISVFPSKAFYDSKLQDGPNMAELTLQPWHKFELTRPFKFLSTKGLESPGRMHSIINKEEANVALALYERLRTDNPRENFDFRIGVVTMYKAQVFELKRVFQQRYGIDITDRIDFNTVDGFQGQEKDIIILSCVRSASKPSSIGFLGDRRRLNVAVTRAKSNLFVVGNAEHLRRGDAIWERLVATAEQQGALQPITVAMLQKGDRTLAKNHATIEQKRPSIANAAPANGATHPKAAPPPGPPPARPPSMAPPTSATSTSTSYAPPPPSTNAAPLRKPVQSPDGLRVGKGETAEKKRKAIVVEDPKILPKKPRVSDESGDRSKSQAQVSQPFKAAGGGAVANGRVKVLTNGSDAQMRPSRPRNPADSLPAGQLRDPTRQSPQGVPTGLAKKPVTPTGMSPRARPPNGLPNRNGMGDGSPRGLAALPKRPASPPKPSNAALNALFVKKRK